MYKRFLAILAIVTTVFAFGVGSAMADKPEDKGPKNPVPACEKEDGPECEDGRPVKDDDDDNGNGGGGTPGPETLCEALGSVVEPLEEPCLAVVAALTGEDDPNEPSPTPELPPFPPEGGFDCTQLGAVPGVGADLQGGCETLSPAAA